MGAAMAGLGQLVRISILGLEGEFFGGEGGFSRGGALLSALVAVALGVHWQTWGN